MVLNTKIALNYVLALTPSFQAALKFEKWDTEKIFPSFKSHKVRLYKTAIKFQAKNVLGSLTYLVSISFNLQNKKNGKSEKVKNLVKDPFSLIGVI